MLLWKNLVPGPNVPQNVYAIIECPKGTRNKYEISKSANVVLLDRVLHSSVMYPHDYGFIPGTYASDGDPLDILVLIQQPSYPLTVIKTKPIGVLIMEDEKGLDEKILAVAENDPVFRDYTELKDIPKHFLDEIKEFFKTYKNLEEPKYSAVKEWRDRQSAYTIIQECVQRFKDLYGDIATIDPFHG